MLESKLIYILAKFLNFTYEIHVPADVLQLGSPDETKGNGSWTGVLGQLLRDEVDMSISFGPWFHSRHLVVDVSVMVVVDEISIMVPYPTQETDARGYLKAYSLWTWILIVGSFWCAILALWAVAHIQQKGERNLWRIMVFVTSVSLGQNDISTYSSASRLVQGSLFLGLLVLSYAFTGILISLITSPKYHFVVRSIEDVIANENIKPLIIHESSTQAEFEESTHPTFQKVFERVKANPKLLVPSSSDLIEVLLSDPHHVLIMSHLLADSEIEKDFRKKRICRATILPKCVNVRTNSLFLQKGSRYTTLINKQLLLLRQAGLSDYLDSSFDTFSSRCDIDERKMKRSKRDRRLSPLTLNDLRGIFGSFAFFFVGSFVVFLCELLTVKCRYCNAF
ncbi:probable glutamate receptor [Daphnia magna]|uniref:probable glutamate receptor n=1 Tax=Daphnia magna TaxID=35525 RepID=UPI001E1BBA3C|nr:probable glutamate receptor [Daphnia magna]